VAFDVTAQNTLVSSIRLFKVCTFNLPFWHFLNSFSAYEIEGVKDKVEFNMPLVDMRYEQSKLLGRRTNDF
jgi:hypothetical protein